MRSVLLTATLACAACGGSVIEPIDEEVAQEGRVGNGVLLNGRRYNTSADLRRGIPDAVTSINSPSGYFYGRVLTNGSRIVVQKDKEWQQRSFAEFGGRLDITIDYGTTVRLTNEHPIGPDLWAYHVEVFDAWGGYASLGEAIPLGMLWNYENGSIDGSGVTLSFRGYAIAKCVELGYRPWATETQYDSDADGLIHASSLHQTCTRMIRADYCGDGQSHTYDGTPVLVTDSFGIQGDDTNGDQGWTSEAVWTQSGALCADSFRGDGEVRSCGWGRTLRRCAHGWNQPPQTALIYTKIGGW